MLAIIRSASPVFPKCLYATAILAGVYGAFCASANSTPLQGNAPHTLAESELVLPVHEFSLEQIAAKRASLPANHVRMRLQLPVVRGGAFSTTMRIDGHLRNINLEPVSVRAAHYRLLVQQPDGTIVPAPSSDIYTYRGDVEGFPGSRVNAVRMGAELLAEIQIDQERRLEITPLSRFEIQDAAADHAIYEPTRPQADLRCGVELPIQESSTAVPGINGSEWTRGGPIYEAELACDSSYRYFQWFGSVPRVEMYIHLMINGVNALYEPNVGIHHSITTLIVRTSAVSNPYPGQGEGDFHAGHRMCQVVNEWQVNQTHVDRDMTVLFCTDDLVDAGDGFYYIGVAAGVPGPICHHTGACNPNPQGQSTGGGAYAWAAAGAVSEHPEAFIHLGNTYSNAVVLTGHELGHLWGALHVPSTQCASFGEYSECTMMIANGRNWGPNFAPQTVSEIVTHRDSIACLEIWSPPAPPEPTLQYAAAQLYAHNGSGAPWNLAAGDINGDGQPDLAITHQGFYSPSALTVTIMTGQPGGGFVLHQEVLMPALDWSACLSTGPTSWTFPTDAQFADMDDDGDLDLICDVKYESLVGNVRYVATRVVWFANEGGTFDSPTASDCRFLDQSNTSTLLGWGATRLDTGDFDADGDLDAVIAAYFFVLVAWNDGSGALSQVSLISMVGNSNPAYIARRMIWCDADNNGSRDVVVAASGGQFNDVNGLRLLDNDGSGQFIAPLPTIAFYPYFDQVADLAKGDLTGDGADDIALTMTNPLAPADMHYTTWESTAGGLRPLGGSYHSGVGRAIEIADLDGIAGNEIAVSHGTQVTFFTNNNEPIGSVAIASGPTHRSQGIALIDVNGDCQNDLVATIREAQFVQVNLNTTRDGSADCNKNGSPDTCDLVNQVSADCNENFIPDSCDISSGLSADVNTNGIPDECETLIPGDLAAPFGQVDVFDLFVLLGNWGTDGAGAELAELTDVVDVFDLFVLLGNWG